MENSDRPDMNRALVSEVQNVGTNVPAVPASLDDAYANGADVKWTIIDDEAILVDLRNDVYYTLNKSGTYVWDAIVQQESVSRAVQRVCSRFDVTEEVARKDVLGLLTELVRSGLISRRG